MHEYVEGFLRGGPIAGVAMTISGVAMWAHRAMASGGPAAELLGQSPPATGPTYETTLVVLGTILTFAFGWWNRYQDARRDNARKDADQERDRRVDDALADIKTTVAAKMADLEVRHAEQKMHLARQDQDLAAIKQAVTPAPSPATD